MKQRIAYTDLAWAVAFARIKVENERLPNGVTYDGWKILWIHDDPPWILLGKKRQRRMVRKGDPLLLELHHE